MRVIVVDDSLIVRRGLAALLTGEGHTVVDELARLEPLEAALAAHQADAVVLDIRMPPTHTDEGLRAAGRLRRTHPTLAILVLSQYVVPEYALTLLDSGERHSGYLLKERVLEEAQLTGALTRLLDGGTVIDTELVTSLIDAKRRAGPIEQLSERERDVLQAMAEGLSDQGMSDRLGVTGNTIRTHIQHIFDKLGIPDAAADNRRVRAVLTYLQATG